MANKKPEKVKLTDAELASPISSRTFWRRVRHFVDHTLLQPDEIPTIKPGTVEWDTWRQYFERHLGWMPQIMVLILSGEREKMTVPCTFPQAFDTRFIEDFDWRPSPPPSRGLPREMRESYEELLRRYGPRFGLRDMESEARKKRWTAPTDDELRAHYPPKQASEPPLADLEGF